MRTTPLALLLLPLLACASEVRVGQSADAILTGEFTEEYSAVVAIYSSEGIACTGTLIAPTVVLTAGHCIDLFEAQEVRFSARPEEGGPSLPTVGFVRHPEFDPLTLENDLGLLLLGQRAPVATAVLPDDFRIRPTSILEVVGYGVTKIDWTGPRERRMGVVEVADVGVREFEISDGGSRPCFGDSGGPAFGFDEFGDPVVVGVVSSGDRSCQKNGRYIDLAYYMEDFIRPVLDGEEESSGAGGCVISGSSTGPSSAILPGLLLLLLWVATSRPRRSL